MAFRKLLLNVLLLVTVSATDTNYKLLPKIIDPILPDYIKPLHYNIKLILIEDNYFHGESNITVSISLATRFVYFHSHLLDINDNSIKITSNVDPEEIHRPLEYSYNFKTHLNTISFNETLHPNTYTLYVQFVGVIIDNNGIEEGLLKMSYINQLEEQEPKWLFVTYFYTSGARRVFPCYDYPALRTTFNVSIKHPRNWKAVSNSPKLKCDSDINSKLEWTHFNITSAIPTHLLWFALMDTPNFTFVETNNITILCEKYIYTSNVYFAQSIIENTTMILRSFKTNTTNAYHIIIPDYQYPITDNWAIAFYRKMDVVFNEQLDSVVRQVQIAYSVALKTTNQWFTNTINPIRWSYLWLHKGLSTWIGTLILDQIMPELRIMDLFLVQTQHDYLHMDVNSFLAPVASEVDELSESIDPHFTFHYYFKASVILRMLYHTLSPEIFWNGLKIFITTHQFNSTTPDDLWSAMESVLNDSHKEQFSNFNLKMMMDTWMSKESYPILNVKRDYKTADIFVTSTSESGEANSWFIPITYASRTTINETQLNKSIWLEPSKPTATISSIVLDDWIVLNIFQAGYYRVQYDNRNWRRIARYLKSCERPNMNVLNRAQLVDDAFYFLMAGQLKLSTFFELTQYLEIETDYVAWYPMIKAFEYMSGYLPFPASKTIKGHMRNLVGKLLDNLGLQEQPNEATFNAQLREEGIKWICALGDARCKAISTEINLYREQQPELPYTLGWQKWSHCNGLVYANVNEWDRMISLWERSQDSRILESLACAEDPAIIYKHSRLLLSSSYIRKKIRSPDHIRIFFAIVVRHVKDDNVLKFILDNFTKVKPRKVSTIATITVMCNYVYSTEQLTSIMNFAKSEVNEEMYLEIESKIKTRMDQIERQSKHFQYLSETA